MISKLKNAEIHFLMYRKVHFRILAVFVLICSTFACNLGDTHLVASDAEGSELRLAAWNIRIMSNKSRTDAELQAIARTLADYDFIAIVELRDEAVLKRNTTNSRADGQGV